MNRGHVETYCTINDLTNGCARGSAREIHTQKVIVVASGHDEKIVTSQGELGGRAVGRDRGRRAG